MLPPFFFHSQKRQTIAGMHMNACPSACPPHATCLEASSVVAAATQTPTPTTTTTPLRTIALAPALSLPRYRSRYRVTALALPLSRYRFRHRLSHSHPLTRSSHASESWLIPIPKIISRPARGTMPRIQRRESGSVFASALHASTIRNMKRKKRVSR